MAISSVREQQLQRVETPDSPAAPNQVDAPRNTIAPRPLGYAGLNSFENPLLARPNLTGTTRLEQLRSNAETAALGRLDPAQREQYADVMHAVQDDPAAQSAVRSLLLNGKLTRSEAFDKSGNLLDQLSRLASPTTQMQPGVDRTELLGQIAKDVQRPFSIDQGEKNYFCGAAAVSTGLAYRNPAEYARLAVGLGTEGQVELAGRHRRDSLHGDFQRGDHVTITAKPEALDEPGRSVTQRLLAPALTEYANGERYTTDEHGVNRRTSGNRGDAEVRGLYSRQLADMQSAVFGRGFRSFRFDDNARATGPDRDTPVEARRENQARDLVQEQLNNGVQVAIKIDEHWVNVTGFDGTNFTYTDSEGAQKTISAAEIFNRADAITYEEAAVTAPPPGEQGAAPPPPDTLAAEEADEGEDAGGGVRPNTGTVDPGD